MGGTRELFGNIYIYITFYHPPNVPNVFNIHAFKKKIFR